MIDSKKQKNKSSIENPPVDEAHRGKRAKLPEIPQPDKNNIAVGRLLEVLSENKRAMMDTEYRVRKHCAWFKPLAAKKEIVERH